MFSYIISMVNVNHNKSEYIAPFYSTFYLHALCDIAVCSKCNFSLLYSDSLVPATTFSVSPALHISVSSSITAVFAGKVVYAPFITDTFELFSSCLTVIIRMLLKKKKKPQRCKEREEIFKTFTHMGCHGNHLVII